MIPYRNEVILNGFREQMLLNIQHNVIEVQGGDEACPFLVELLECLDGVLFVKVLRKTNHS